MLLAELGGGTMVPGATYASAPVEPVSITMAADYPDRVAGVAYGLDTVPTAAAPGRLHGHRRTGCRRC